MCPRTSSFDYKRNVKRAEKQGRDTSFFKTVIYRLCRGETLEPHFQDHELKGKWKGMRECHLLPNWLLVYEQHEDEIILHRLGTHAELFKK